MFCILLIGQTKVFCDNEAVVLNASHLDSTLRGKHIVIANHCCHEAQAAGYAQIGHQDGKANPADVLTKLLLGSKMHVLLWQ
jgi:hypothetical protein